MTAKAFFWTNLSESPDATDPEAFKNLWPLHSAIKQVEQFLNVETTTSLVPTLIELGKPHGFQPGEVVFVNLGYGSVHPKSSGLGVNAIARENGIVQFLSGKARSFAGGLIPNLPVWLHVDSGVINNTPLGSVRLQYLGTAITSSDFFFAKYPIMEAG